MAKKSKEKTLDIKNIKNGNTKKNNEKEQDTKDKKFDFNEEIVIGLKKIEEEPKKVEKKKNKKKSNKKTDKTKTKKKVNKDKKNKDVKPENENEIDINITIDKPAKKQATKKLTPKQELARKRRKIIFRIIKWTSLLLIVIGATIATLLSPIFNVKKVDVVGNSKLTTDEIISLSKIELDKNMFQYNKNEIINQIKENPYVENVIVKRKIPDTMEVIIEERKPSFKFQLANAYVLINNQGYILEISAKTPDLPIIIGIETAQEDIQVGNRLCIEDLKKLNDILKIIESATSNDLVTLITKIDIRNKDDYILTLTKMKKTVHLGDTSNLNTKMAWIIEFNEIEGNTEGEIILNINLDKRKPYFKPKK